MTIRSQPTLESGMTSQKSFSSYLVATLAIGALTAATTGCPKKTPDNDFGDKTEEAAEDVGDKVEEVGD
jgi:hypothetical protein